MLVALYADDGALWVRGCGIGTLESRMQKAIDQVGKWSHEWGFRYQWRKQIIFVFIG